MLVVSKRAFAILGTYDVWPKGRIVQSSHPVAKRFPDHFVPVEDAVFEPVETATAAPGERRAYVRKAKPKATPEAD